jgi:anti-anti-sigma factor
MSHPDESRIGIVRFSGELDIARRSEIARKLATIAGASVAILDLSDVTYVDSTFLGELGLFYQRLLEGKEPFAIRVAGAGRQVQRLLEIANFNTFVEFFDTVEQARSAEL